MQSYRIHSNGGVPYTVNITNNVDGSSNVSVLINEDEAVYKGPEYKTKQVFIGKSPLNKKTEFSGGHGDEFDGNSILLNKEEWNYVFIGNKIMEFEALCEIVEYVSPVGNSDVPYPYAIDVNGNYYLMIEDVILINYKNIEHNHEDCYWFYYENSKITPEYRWDDDGNRIIDENFQYTKDKDGMFIKEGYVLWKDREDEDDRTITLRWHPDPEEDFNRFDEIGYLDNDGNEDKFTLEDYVELNNRFGAERGFMSLGSTIIHDSSKEWVVADIGDD